ncbi:alpha/beta hydrolase [Actinomadura rudentiformis]|uniref:alpha/beta hydrolase n=1 Tax=Actinomadura rudentiformis TaxID=359158 RepID=UPI00178C7BB7|nr:alpha/beta hydrolase [Actinomadura rudentiformis]
MTRLGRTAGVLIACAAVVVSGSAPVQAAPKKISWKRCADDRTAQCGYVSVPINWGKPKRGRIKIAVARVKAKNPKKRLGVLFVNPGGPGGSGIDFALDRAGLSKQIRERYDIVGFDPRGVGRSHAVKCGNVGKAPRRYPGSQKGFGNLKAYQGKLYKACRKKTGLLYDFLGAGSVARDMDAIRAALGAQKVSYYGRSYGTWLGQRYAEMFPKRVKRMTLDGAMNHQVKGALAFSVDEAKGLEAGFLQFAKWCPTSKHCGLRGKDPVKVLDALMLRAEKGRLHEIGEPKVRLTPPELAQMVRNSMYEPIAWAQLSEELKELSRQKERVVKAYGANEEPDGAFAGILCTDWSFPIKNYKQLADVRAKTRRAAPHVRLNPLGWEAITACIGRPRGAKDPQRPYRIKGVQPILVAGSLGDPATVYPWAVGAQRGIPGAALLTYEGAGHGAYGLSGCARKTIDTYLLNGTKPAPGARCPARMPDFSQMRAEDVPRDSVRRF